MKTTERVTEVIDGNTFKTESRSEQIRSAGYNAPGLDEMAGDVAKKSLERLILDKHVTIVVVSTDTCGRSVAKVWLGDDPVSDLMRYTMTIF